MRVRVSRKLPPSIEDPDDFTRLSVLAVDMPAMQVGQHLGALGVSDAEHVRLNVAALRDLLGESLDEPESERFDHMIAYARSKGWVDEHDRVRAHVEIE